MTDSAEAFQWSSWCAESPTSHAAYVHQPVDVQKLANTHAVTRAQAEHWTRHA